ncbi:hypothetical protein EIP86_008371 [Pleurotus ostreatoroseus]|nr:hypothetical protein EIP86_008371 [Pleurotus ostreatoroseus]
MYVVPTAYMSLMPLATFFIFGLSYDCLLTWKSWILFWRPPPVPPKSAALSLPRDPVPALGPPPAYYYSPYKPSPQNQGIDKPLPRLPPPIYVMYATSESMSPAVNDAKARGEQLPVMDIC